MRRKWIFWMPLFLLGFLAFIAVGGLVVRELWNWLLPPLFGARPVTFWQALGVLALCRILFGGFGGGRHRSRFRRWEAVTPEDRERLRHRMPGRSGSAPSESTVV